VLSLASRVLASLLKSHGYLSASSQKLPRNNYSKTMANRRMHAQLITVPFHSASCAITLQPCYFTSPKPFQCSRPWTRVSFNGQFRWCTISRCIL